MYAPNILESGSDQVIRWVSPRHLYSLILIKIFLYAMNMISIRRKESRSVRYEARCCECSSPDSLAFELRNDKYSHLLENGIADDSKCKI